MISMKLPLMMMTMVKIMLTTTMVVNGSKTVIVMVSVCFS